MDETLECIEDTQADLVQTIQDATCSGSRVLLDTDYNAVLLELSAEEWMQLFSCILLGGDLAYPEISHELHWKWVKALECAMTFCEHVIECIETDVPTRRAFADANVLPIGTIITYITTSAPPHCLPLTGGTYLRVDYPLLYAALSSEFIVDADNFTLPDVRGRFLWALGDGDETLGDIGGEETHTLTEAEMPAHSHNYTRADAAENLYAAGTNFAIRNRSTQASQSVGGGQAHNNMPPYLIVNYCIVAE